MNTLDGGASVDILARRDRDLVELVMAVAIEQPQQPILAADANHLVLLAVDGRLEQRADLTDGTRGACRSWRRGQRGSPCKDWHRAESRHKSLAPDCRLAGKRCQPLRRAKPASTGCPRHASMPPDSPRFQPRARLARE